MYDCELKEKFAVFEALPQYRTIKKLATLKPQVLISRDFLKLYFKSFSKEDLQRLMKLYLEFGAFRSIDSQTERKFQFSKEFLECIQPRKKIKND